VRTSPEFVAFKANPTHSLIIASEYDPLSIIEMLSPYIAGSGALVVHSPHIQVACFPSD
jgi:hypothetical protein